MLARVIGVIGAAAIAVGVAAGPASADTVNVTALSPTAGVVGTPIVITGTGLSAVTAVGFANSADVAVTPVSDSEIDLAVPSTAQSGAVLLRAPQGDVTGPVFDVLPLASIAVSARSITYPATVTVTSALTSGGVGVPGQPATLEARLAATSVWNGVATATTDANGAVSFVVRPLLTTAYRVAYDATASYGAATSDPLTVVQHPAVSASVPAVAPILTRLHIRGAVRPAQTGSVTLERHYAGAWHTVGRTALSSTSHYTFSVTLPSTARYTYRVRRPADARQAGNVSATAQMLGVHRTLRQGLSGTDVTALQKRLLALHYDVGTVTGSFGFDTTHAVVAFEKVQGLNRDGVVGARVWSALVSPRVARLEHPLAGVAAIEVDLTRQVLYYAVNGRISRILDASTGGGYYYVGSDGATQRAITPTGHFSVKYKVNHWVTAKLGVLYRPAYFNYSGYAIHGEPLVPAYPASHGCVRITVPAMNRLYNKLYDGMSVWIYRS